MAEMLLTIQHKGVVYEPPVKDGIKIDWEQKGAAGQLTFTTVYDPNSSVQFTEGDRVCFYYDGKGVFMGYVFTMKTDNSKETQFTCYDQIRYLKNKFTYVFTKKTASQIIKAMCDDMNLYTGKFDNTGYVIPAVAEENISALDIATEVLEDTLLNTGNMFVLYDDFGNLTVKNAANMVTKTLVCAETATEFSFESSIDSDTYNSVVLYHKDEDNVIKVYSASNNSKINEWGLLRLFEEVKDPTIAQSKANGLLQLYCHKTRSLTVNGVFGSTDVRGGTLIPTVLDLGHAKVQNYMLVEKVTHNFNKDYYTMDLTLGGAWE